MKAASFHLAVFLLLWTFSPARRIDSDNRLPSSHSRDARELLNHARALGLPSLLQIDSNTPSTSPTSSSSSSDTPQPLNSAYFNCEDTKYQTSICPTTTATIQKQCGTTSDRIPLLPSQFFCPKACTTCYYKIFPQNALSNVLSYCTSNVTGQPIPCLSYEKKTDFLVKPRELNKKIFWSLLSREGRRCLQDVSSDQITSLKSKFYTALTTDTSLTATQYSDIAHIIRSFSAVGAGPSYLGPCIQGAYEELQQWQIIPTSIAFRYLLQNRKTNRCLHFSLDSTSTFYQTMTTKECVDPTFPTAKNFYNQAILLSAKKQVFTIQQQFGARMCVAAPPSTTSTKGFSSLSAVSCTTDISNGRHAFVLNSVGKCYIKKAEDGFPAGEAGRYCPYQIAMSSSSSSMEVTSTSNCLVVKPSSIASSGYSVSLQPCSVSASSEQQALAITSSGQSESSGGTSAVGVLKRDDFVGPLGMLQQGWYVYQSDYTKQFTQVELRFVIGGQELCLAYSTDSQGAVGLMLKCSLNSSSNSKTWSINAYDA